MKTHAFEIAVTRRDGPVGQIRVLLATPVDLDAIQVVWFEHPPALLRLVARACAGTTTYRLPLQAVALPVPVDVPAPVLAELPRRVIRDAGRHRPSPWASRRRSVRVCLACQQPVHRGGGHRQRILDTTCRQQGWIWRTPSTTVQQTA